MDYLNGIIPNGIIPKLIRIALYATVTAGAILAAAACQFAIRGFVYLLSQPYDESNFFPQPLCAAFGVSGLLLVIFCTILIAKIIVDFYSDVATLDLQN